METHGYSNFILRILIIEDIEELFFEQNLKNFERYFMLNY